MNRAPPIPTTGTLYRTPFTFTGALPTPPVSRRRSHGALLRLACSVASGCNHPFSAARCCRAAEHRRAAAVGFPAVAASASSRRGTPRGRSDAADHQLSLAARVADGVTAAAPLQLLASLDVGVDGGSRASPCGHRQRSAWRRQHAAACHRCRSARHSGDAGPSADGARQCAAPAERVRLSPLELRSAPPPPGFAAACTLSCCPILCLSASPALAILSRSPSPSPDRLNAPTSAGACRSLSNMCPG